MANLTLRILSRPGDVTKNAPLTYEEADNNFINLDADIQALGVSLGGKEPSISAGTTSQYFRGDKSWQTLNKSAVGLGNVDNTSDASKAVLSATKLATARTINGVSFDGTTNITVADSTKLPLTGGTVTGELISSATNSFRMTQGNYGTFWRNDGTNTYLMVTASGDPTGTYTAARPFTMVNATGVASINGNAATATKLATPRTINGVNFDGTANITVADSTKAPLNGTGTSGTWPISVSGNAATASYCNLASDRWVSALINAVSSSGDGSASVEVRNNGGTGDAGLAAIAFHCAGAYAAKLHLRHDGFFGFGGWSRVAWGWYLDSSNNMVAAGNVTAYSDPRLKENFKRIEDPMAILSKLDGGTFNWRHGFPHIESKAGKRDYGVLADQVQAVMPEIVTNSIDIEGESYLTVSYEKLVPVLIEAVKELEARIKAMEGE